MDSKTILAVLASLTSASLPLACDKHDIAKSEITDVPGDTKDPAPAAGEHSCGNHEEGACGGGSEAPTPGAAAATSRSFEIAPDGFAEVNFTMKMGSKVTVTFAKGSSDFTWNVHSHDHSGGSKIHDEGVGREGTVVFTATEDGMFSVLWKNDQTSMTPLEVSVALGDGATIHSWMPAE